MPELTDRDAIMVALDYYTKEKGYSLEDAARLVNILLKIDLAGLIEYAYGRRKKNNT